ncbi:GNAT family N-acetyltransferase [Lichenicoccus sp.]|uniref:GNAT family N-acetyltransferase n=1 Tax=Lichenicoccus sp. TaxID=2781899 RepID=UPI003D09C693
MKRFEAKLHSRMAHRLLVEAYKDGGGRAGSYEQWWSTLLGDAEYDPQVFFLAVDQKDQIVGLGQCWTTAFLKDLAVSAAWRRRGVGRALLLHAFTVFRARGAEHFDLKVEHDNPSGAERLYLRLGFTAVV